MIVGTILKDQKIRLILQGTDTIDEEILKQLDGATVTLVGKDFRLLDKPVNVGLLIEKTKPNE